jgi:hypothetical protein
VAGGLKCHRHRDHRQSTPRSTDPLRWCLGSSSSDIHSWMMNDEA